MCIFNKKDSQEVLASWLFCQFMLTNDVQIAYAQTEGYCPVTLKAQKSDTYVDYLSRQGEDNQMYYDIKLKATKLLMDNTANTFVTPVFNGSASLRNAAGYLIEDINKNIRRKQTVDSNYLVKLQAEATSLYRLDQINTTDGKISLGPMPMGSIVLLSSIGICWIGIISYIIKEKIKSKSIN